MAHGWRGWSGTTRRSRTGSKQEASDLKRRFNRDFWLADRGYFAIALDADGSQVDSLASNNGLLLWSGIVDASKAKSVVGHLMGPRLYSGWGVRTLAEGEARYNPIGYHLGTVWPFDNSFIAWGLRRYGFKEEAARIARDILDAAALFDGRLPEAFGGYDRSVTKYPVQYPTACSPQAWSTGAPLLLLRTVLGLEPMGDHLIVDPALPDTIGHLELLDIPGRWGRIDAFGRGRIALDGHDAKAHDEGGPHGGFADRPGVRAALHSLRRQPAGGHPLAKPYVRLTQPLVRDTKGGELRPATWDEALDRTVDGFLAAKAAHGPTTFGTFSCSKATNEVNFAAQKFSRTVLGSNNIDSCNRT